MSRFRSIGVIAGLVAAAALSFAAAPAPAAAPRVSSPISSHHGNPHLHGAVTTTAAHDKGRRPDREHRHDPDYDRAHSHWYGVWNAWAYISRHRGLGSIAGVVRGTPGGALQVKLRRPNGHAFRSISKKHRVLTAANGNFLMTGVRAGAYRIVAQMPNQKHTVHTQVHVRTGHTSTVGLRW